MSLTDRDVLDALRNVCFPGFSKDIVSVGAVQSLRVDEGRVRFDLVLGQAPPEAAQALRREAESAVRALGGVTEVEIRAAGSAAEANPLRLVNAQPTAAPTEAKLLPEVKHTIAVASGKGGVGKSTVAVNLAVALARSGASVGLLDADVYGPSIPLMMGMTEGRPTFDKLSQRLVPMERYGVRFISLGNLLPDPESAVIWRGPMVMKALEQLLGDVAWGALDVLVVDMPPGTGDAQLTLAQRVSLAGAVIVTTPQDVALADAIKGVAMFRKVNVPVLGLVENMSYFNCPECGHRSEIFDHGGGRTTAKRLGVPFLGEIPLDAEIRSGGDSGRPVTAADAPSAQGAAFAEVAGAVLQKLTASGSGSVFERFRQVWGKDDPRG